MTKKELLKEIDSAKGDTNIEIYDNNDDCILSIHDIIITDNKIIIKVGF